ncbi:MAG TPA: hypothetical protein VMZ53_05975 [Kofleriaceae bacterium]|nr:hypothetical protein [Kofleriaceae bacterium]
MRWTSVLLVLGSAAIAHATPQQADVLKGEAEAAVKQNDFVTAAAKFKAAYAADPRPDLICNVGVAYFKAKDLPRAQMFLSRCLERGSALDAKFVDNVRAVLGSVETTLRAGDFTPVDIVVEPGGASVTIDSFGADESFVGARVVWLPKGTHQLKAAAEGYVERAQTIEATGHDRMTLQIVLAKQPAVVEPPPVGSGAEQGSGAGAGSGSAIVVAPPPAIVQPPKRSLVAPIVATAGTAAALAVAIVARGKAFDASDRAKLALNNSYYDADVSKIHTWNAVFVTGVAVSVAGAGLSAYLWYRAFDTPSHVEVQPASGGGVVSLSGRW